MSFNWNPRKDTLRRSIRLWWEKHCITVVAALGWSCYMGWLLTRSLP